MGADGVTAWPLLLAYLAGFGTCLIALVVWATRRPVVRWKEPTMEERYREAEGLSYGGTDTDDDD